MPKQIGVYKRAQLIEAPMRWEHMKIVPGYCNILMSETLCPGKYYFFFWNDRGLFYPYQWLRCSPGDMTEEDGILTFHTRSGNTYKFQVGEFTPDEFVDLPEF